MSDHLSGIPRHVRITQQPRQHIQIDDLPGTAYGRLDTLEISEGVGGNTCITFYLASDEYSEANWPPQGDEPGLSPVHVLASRIRLAEIEALDLPDPIRQVLDLHSASFSWEQR